MGGSAIVAILFWALLSQADCQCTLDDGQPAEGKEFPDIFAQSALGYQLTTQLSGNKVKETVLVDEYYSILYKAGRVNMYRTGKDFKQFVYFQETNEAFTVSGFSCEVSELQMTAPPFLEDGPYRWLDYEDDVTLLGPSATVRQGYLAWKRSKVVYLGNIEEDRSIKLDKWKQCLKLDNQDITLYYYFSEPTWHNAYNFTGVQVPVRFQYITSDEVQTLEFFNYQFYINNEEVVYNVPVGYGCNRTAKTDEDVPDLGARNHRLRGEMVYHSINMEEKKVSSFISNFEITYHSRSEMIAYSYAPWKKGAMNKDETVQTKPFTRIVWDNRNSILYTMNMQERKCELVRDSQFFPSFELPGEDDGSIDLLDPSILTLNDGFKYLGDKNERGIPVKIFEKEVRPMFLGDRMAPVGIITRLYSSYEAIINTGNQEREIPIRITIRWFSDEEKTKPLGFLVINIHSYSTDVPFIHNYFDVGMCFRDYDASTWVKLTFPNMGVRKNSLQAFAPEIQEEFLGFLLMNTETTPARVQRILVDVTDDDFSVDALILERPPYQMEFDLRGKYEINNWNKSYGILSEDECLKSCVDYGKVLGINCKIVSYCGASCFVTTVGAKTAGVTENGECKLYDRPTAFESLPSMEELVRSIRNLVVTNSFSLSFPINVGDNFKLTTFKASSFGDSFGDTRDRLVPQLLREQTFKISFPGMKLTKGDQTKSKPAARFSLSSCLQVCLNNPNCETVSYCRGTECVLSETYISDFDLDRMVKDNKCMVLARNYVQAYNAIPGVTLTKSAKSVSKAQTEDGCAKHCTKETNFECRSFDFCKDKEECLLHTSHYLHLKSEGEGMKVTDNCTHYSKKYVYDFKKVPGRRAVGDVEVSLRQNSVEECAKECSENGGFFCTAFDFCEGVEVIDNKCFLISTSTDSITTVDRTDCSHYINRNSNVKLVEGSDGTRYSSGLAGGLGFMFFLIGGAIGVVATYFIAFKYANRR